MSGLNYTSLNWGVSEELVVPIAIGTIILTVNIGVLREMAIIAAFFAMFGSLSGFGLGIISLPIYFRTGLGFLPPVLSPRFSDTRQSSGFWTVHVVSAVYYSYLAAFLGFGLGMGASRWVAALDDPQTAGTVAGLVVGFVFLLGQVWGATREAYSVTYSSLGLWLAVGISLILPGRLWWLFIPRGDL